MPNYYTKPKYLTQKAIGANNAPSIPNPDTNAIVPIPPIPVGGPGGYADPYDPRIGNGALPVGISGSQQRAYTREVQGNELAAQQISALLNQNGAYIQSARQSGIEFANSRGLGNSSIAAGNAQREAIKAGAPIALSDADAYRAAAGENLQYLNERQLADIRSQDNSNSNATQLAAQRMGDESALMRQRENLAFDGEQNGLDRVQQRDMVEINERWRDWGGARQDARTDRYENGRAYRDHTLGIDNYRQRTGIDLQRETATNVQNFIAYAAERPDLFPPAVMGAFMSFVRSAGSEDLNNLLGGGRRP